MPRLSGTGLSVRKFGDQRRIDVTVALAGASGSAEPGSMSTDIGSSAVVSPAPLWTVRGKNFSPKGVSEGDGTLTSARAQAQGNPLLGAHVTIYIDGAQAVAQSGRVTVIQPGDGVGAPSGGYGAVNWDEEEKKKKDQRKKEIAALMRELYDMSPDP